MKPCILIFIVALSAPSVRSAQAAVLSREIESLGAVKTEDETAQADLRLLLKQLGSLDRNDMIQRIERVGSAFTDHADAYVAIRRFDDHRTTYSLQLLTWEDRVVSVVEVTTNGLVQAKVAVRLFNDESGDARKAAFDAINECSPSVDFSMRHRVFDQDYVLISFDDTKARVSGCKAVYGPGFVPPEGRNSLGEELRALSGLALRLHAFFQDVTKKPE